jgi:hypothetical protein
VKDRDEKEGKYSVELEVKLVNFPGNLTVFSFNIYYFFACMHFSNPKYSIGILFPLPYKFTSM